MTSVPRLSAARLERLRQELSPRDSAVLQDIDRCRLMSGRQLQELHVGQGETAARAARRLLARLVRHGLLARLQRQVGGVRAGSSGFTYGLGPAGVRLLHPGAPRRRLYEVRDGFLSHTLALSELYVLLRQAEQRGQLELLTLETEPRSWRRMPDGDWLKPDLHVVIGLGEEALHSFVELDRGTEHSPALVGKLRQYETAYRGGVAATAEAFPRVVWLVPSDRRAAQLRRLLHSSRLTPELHAVALQSEALAALTGGELDSRPPPNGPDVPDH
ncbi:replication-relaxation family protein [Geodermatophilus sp. SYSU D01176]